MESRGRVELGLCEFSSPSVPARLIGEVTGGELARNSFQPWEVEILMDLENCQLDRRHRLEIFAAGSKGGRAPHGQRSRPAHEALGIPRHPDGMKGRPYFARVTAPSDAEATSALYFANTPVVYRGAGAFHAACRFADSSGAMSRSSTPRSASTVMVSPS
jgi:hypothetical protein